MVITNDAAVASRCASLRHQAYSSTPYLHDAIAYNFRLTEMQAAIGIVQLRRLDEITGRRRATASFYDEAVSHSRFTRPTVRPSDLHAYYQYTLRTADEATRDATRRRLDEAAIATGVYYPVPVHRQPPYQHLSAEPCPAAEAATRDMFSIPVHPLVSDQDRERIVCALADG